MECGLKRLQCRTGARYRCKGRGKIIAVTVGEPDRVQVVGRILQRDVITGSCLNGTNRQPEAELACRDGRTTVLQSGSGPAAGGIHEVVTSDFYQAGGVVIGLDEVSRSHREARPTAPQDPVIDTDLNCINRSQHTLIGQLRELGGRNIDFLVVRLSDPVEEKMAGAGIHECIGRDRIAVRVRGREQR